MCSIGLKRLSSRGNWSSLLSLSNHSSSVRRYFMLSFASSRAVNTSLHSRANVVQYVLFERSSARSTRRMRFDCSWSKIELRLFALFFQNAISTSGVGCMPCLSCDSGSCLSTLLICFVHVMMAPSSSEMRFFPFEVSFTSSGGIGSRVSPLTWPHRIVVDERNV